MIAGQLAGLWRHRQRPDELAVKRLAMLGAIALVLVDGLRDTKARGSAAAASYAGLLLDRGVGRGDRRGLGLGPRSALALLGRVLLAALFMYVGYTQARLTSSMRIPARQSWGGGV